MAKRGQGEGSIFKRKDGRWAGAITLENSEGKHFLGKTRKEVQDKLTAALDDLREGTLVDCPRQTMDEYLNRWLEDCAKLRVRARTYDGYCLSVRRLCEHIGKVQLSELKPQRLQAAYSRMLKLGLSERSVQLDHTVLHSALKQAVLWNLIARNPADAVTAPRPKRREMQTLNNDQAHALFAATTGDQHHALWVLLVTTGLRLGEATGLRWADVDLEKKRLSVQRSLQYQAGVGISFVEPKTEHSRRTVCLPDSTAAVLRHHRTRQLEQRLALGSEWQAGNLVFSSEWGNPLMPSTVEKAFIRALAKAGLPRIRVHDLRHTAATLLLTQGTHPKIVQEMLGHSSITLTLDTYSHVTPTMQAEAARTMDGLFQQG